MNGNKKKRGCNYTPIEKEILVDIIKKYIDIIENKETNAQIIIKKRTTWNEITQRFNAMATTGPRNWTQLRHLYENIKQRSKKNIAKENRQQFYAEDLNINDLVKKASSDKKEMTPTGGTAYTSVLTETDKQIPAMVSPSQVKPMQNSFYDAASYFGDVEPVTHLITTPDIEEDCSSVAFIEKTEVPAQDPIPSSSRGLFNDSITYNNKKQPIGKRYCNSVKEQYFKLKLSNAKLERKFLIQRHKMEMKKHTLELEILNLRRKIMLK